MACKRNRILEIKSYLESAGITVNIGKTKARGNRGVFLGRKNNYRIDVSKNLTEDEIVSVLIHEFAHYLHYCYDKSLKSLDFVFENTSEEILEELRNITVAQIPKEAAEAFFTQKNLLNNEIKLLSSSIKKKYPDFKTSSRYMKIEKQLSYPVNYLLKFDKIKVFNRIYSLEDMGKDFSFLSEEQKAYIMLCSKRRAVSRINNKIAKLNKYYNNSSELFARFFEFYLLHPQKAEELAPAACRDISEALKTNKIPALTEFCKIIV